MASILIVDDNSTDRQLLVTLMRYAGHRLLEAADGVEALDIARRESPDLVITDVLMPRMDGFELVRRLRETLGTARTSIVFYTANYLEQTARSLAQTHGVARFLTKPMEPQTLLLEINAVLTAPADPRSPPPQVEMERQHMRLVNDKLTTSVQALEAANARLSVIAEVGRHLASETDPAALVETSCAAARDLVDATYAAIALCFGDKPTPSRFADSWVDGEHQRPTPPWAPDPRDLEQTLGAPRPMRLQGHAAAPAATLLPERLACDSFLAVPIESPTRPYGWLYFANKLGYTEFTAEDERLALMLAMQLGVSYENNRRYELIQESEERWRSLVEFSPEPILVHDGESVVYANPASARLLAAPRTVNVVGRSVGDLVPHDASLAPEALIGAVQEPRPVETLEQQLVRLDGRIVDVEGVSAPIRFGGQERRLVILRDVTESKRAQELLAQKERYLAAINEIGRIASATLDLPAVFPAIAEVIREVIEADRIVIGLLDPLDPAQMTLFAVHTFGVPTETGVGIRLPVDLQLHETPVSATPGGFYEDHEGMLIEDLTKVRAPYVQRLVMEGLRARIGAPLVVKDRRIGVLGVSSRRPGAYRREQLPLVNAIADQLAPIIENARLYVEIQRSAVSRGLVGQILHDLAAAGLSDGAIYRAGLDMPKRQKASSLQDFLASFNDMGLGTVSLVEEGIKRRWTFEGDGLVEVRSGSRQPSCHYTRGFLCGALTQIHPGIRVVATETACQSLGDPACRFIAQAMD